MAKRSLVQIIREEKFLLIGASFLVAHSAAGFLTAVISDLIMPPISEALGESDWTTAAVEAGSISLKWGDSLGTGLHLVVVEAHDQVHITALCHNFDRQSYGTPSPAW